MIEKCPNPKPFCAHRYTKRGCYADKHHIFYPSTDYQTPIEQAYRDLPQHTIQMCRQQHDDVHEGHLPPIKPDLVEMLRALHVPLIEGEEYGQEAA